MGLEVAIKKKLGSFGLDVRFETEKGIFAILGASGCGKSMTLKCIAGIETPDEGRIVLNGRVLFDSDKKINLAPQKRRVGYMFQDYALFPNMTVEQNIMAGMGKRPDREKVRRYLERLRLTGLERQRPGQLSGGQKQRVAMARMIAAEPDVLLLDEPFSALDSYLKWELEQEMRDILAEIDKPVLFVSHNRDEVYRLCATVGCLNRGKMEVIEEVKEFFRNPKTKAAALLSGCKNISAAKILDETHVEATDWGVVLTVPCVPEHTAFVGIRAHFFKPCPREEAERENVFAVSHPQVTEDPFEWNVSFLTCEEGSRIQWKIPKTEGEEVSVPDFLRIDGRQVLLLSDGEAHIGKNAVKNKQCQEKQQ